MNPWRKHDVRERAGSEGGHLRARLLATGAAALAVVSMTAGTATAASWRAVSSAAASPLTSSPAPTVTKLKPEEGPLIGGLQVLIKGAHLTGATAVDFGSSSASFKAKSAGEIYATAPAGEGTVDVTVTTPEGTSATNPGDRFRYVATVPVVDELSPNTAPEKYRQKVVVKGRGFTGATAVDFGSASAEFTVNSPDVITAYEPVGTGVVNVTVTTPEGTSAITPADEFTYTGRPPEVDSVSPGRLPATGGTVSIGGHNFLGATSVEFGGVSATSFSVGVDSITATVAPATVGKVSITVTTPYGTSGEHYCSDGEFCPVLLQFADPTITGLSPGSGPAGTVITVAGSGFAIGSTGSMFVFGTTHATSVNCSSTTECTVLAPTHGAGKVRVKETVKGTDITTAANPADEYTYN